MDLGVDVYFTRDVDFTWRVSGCEELVGVPNLCWKLLYAKVFN